MDSKLASITSGMQSSLRRHGGLGTRSAKIQFPGDGVVYLTGQQATNEDKDADCTLTVTRTDYEALCAGLLTPTLALETGKVKVRGDATIVKRLHSVLQP